MNIPAQESAPDELTAPEELGTNAGEIRRGMRMGGEDGKSRARIYFERLIAPVEPDMKGKPERLDVYTGLFEREMVQDARLFATDVQATWDEETETVVLSGYVNFEENRESLESLFKNLAFEKIENNVEVLPSEALGEKRYALVAVPHVFSYDKTADPRERMTQGILGDTVYLLKEGDNNHFLCATAEGYIGYIDGSTLLRVDAKGLSDYRGGTRAIVRQNYLPDPAAPEGAFFIPAGARLKYGNENSDGKVRVILPGGESMMVPTDMVTLRDDVPDSRVIAAVDVAKSIMGTDYVWGGKTREGVDCSGLVQSSFAAQGINLARDAYMQAYNGSLVATRWNRDAMRLGDLMYFLGRNGRITHTAIYLGDGIFIEASGEVKLTSLNPGDENYSEFRDKGFAFAKRVVE